MNFKLDFDVIKNGVELSHKKSIVSLGSCFSEEMGGKLSDAGFAVLNNPFGTLFHPLAIMNVLDNSLNQSGLVESVQRNDLFFAWESSSKLFGKNEIELRDLILSKRDELKSKVKNAGLLILTFGTSIGYCHQELNKTVGNCHKQPQNKFKKELSTIDKMYKACRKTITQIKEINPSIKIMITVSPVRHKKDGLIGNNRSKARLLELSHQLVENDNCIYFPSYEIVIDELRDYRFYKQDLIHPSEDAINFVWEKFASSSIEEQSLGVISEYQKIKASLSHRSLFPNTKEDIARIQKAEESKSSFISIYPHVNWG